MYAKKTITDTYTFIFEGAENPRINIHSTWPFIKFGKDGGLLSSYKFTETSEEISLTIDLRSGRLGRISIFDLSPLEIVNSHQWHAQTPITTKNSQTGAVTDEEPPLWEIAGVDNGTAERFTVMVTHGRKNDVFRVTTRLNTILDYSRSLVSPWRAELEDGEKIPLDDLQDAINQNPPSFKFLTHKAEVKKPAPSEVKDTPKRAVPERIEPRYGLALSVVFGIGILLFLLSSIQ